MDFVNTTTLEIIFYFLFSGNSFLSLNKYYEFQEDDGLIDGLTESSEKLYNFHNDMLGYKLLYVFKTSQNDFSLASRYDLDITLKNEVEGKSVLTEFLQKQTDLLKIGEITSSEYYPFKRNLLVLNKIFKDYRNEYDNDSFTINSEFNASEHYVIDKTIKFNKIRFIELLFDFNKEGLIQINGCKQIKSNIHPAIKPFSLDINITLLKSPNEVNLKPSIRAKQKTSGEKIYTKNELLEKIDLNDSRKKIFEFALSNNHKSFDIEDLRTYYDNGKKPPDVTSLEAQKRLETISKYLNNVNRALKEFFSDSDATKNYIFPDKDKNKKSGIWYCAIPVKED